MNKDIFGAVKTAAIMAWCVGVPLIQKKYPLETEAALRAYTEMERLRAERDKE